MVHGVVEQSGGRLILNSEQGLGTTAELWLPCAPESAISKSATPVEPPAVKIGPLLVLLVDDDSLVLHSTSAMLEDLGHRVLEASSAAHALNLIDAHDDVDLVITDHVMSGGRARSSRILCAEDGQRFR
jgi:hypothetical protein